MTFLRGTNQVSARLIHHTGSMIRFTTAQLPTLPPTDVQCQVILPDGRVVDGRFKRNPANPYIGGPDLVRWIKTWARANEPVDVEVEQFGRLNQVRIHTVAVGPVRATPLVPVTARRAVGRSAVRLGRIGNAARRRTAYRSWERNPSLRLVALDAWPPRCQVSACASHRGMPDALLPALVEVHHVVSVAARGADSPLNVCLLCANHHAVIHRAPQSVVQSCDLARVVIQVDGITLVIDRDVRNIWELADV